LAVIEINGATACTKSLMTHKDGTSLKVPASCNQFVMFSGKFYVWQLLKEMGPLLVQNLS
jgi:hypothetical protein